MHAQRHAYNPHTPELTRRHDGARGDHAARLHHSAVQQRRAHAHKAAVADGRGVHQRAVADGYAVANHGRSRRARGCVCEGGGRQSGGEEG